MRIFNLDSPLMQGLSKMADLMWLNILTIFLCLPVVTAGAALTAMNYMALKIVRDEECYVTKGFFKSFKENFRQATIIWIILLAVVVVLGIDFYVFTHSETPVNGVIQVAVMVAAILVLFTSMFLFPVLAKFDNSIMKTIKNALILSLVQFPKTILMIIVYLIPIIITIYVFQLMPLVFMFGISVPAWISAKLYNKFFQKLEDRINQENAPEITETEGEEDERIFRDELDPALAKKDAQE